MAINLKEIEEKVKPLGGRSSYNNEFIFELLTAFGRASSNITRLRNGQLNIANNKKNEVAQKNVVYFKPTFENVYSVIDDLKSDPTVVRYNTRFVIVTNYEKLLAIDTKTNETLDISIKEIDKYYVFFLPWAGMEKAQFVGENHADVKAAEKMAKLFDAIVENNNEGNADYYHGLNVFFTRLLFCYFAEDTGVFDKSQFTNAISSFTQEDGSDLSHFLTELFTAFDIKDRTGYSSHIAAFPYVNGGLFRESRVIPEFNRKARDLLIECGSKLDWSNINPDIFGSMIQAVVNPGQRAGLGMHYTSVPNIMKVIEPLFLDDIRDEVNASWDNTNKLDQVLTRISKIQVFDPACGSGNFLIIAYKELRKLEHTILDRQGKLGATNATLLGSRVHIDNFYGIEIDDFAHEVAILSLWLAKHQMNIEFRDKFGIDLSLIPLNTAGNIVFGNAARIDWGKVCPNNGVDEIYLISNPPYQGARLQDKTQKDDFNFAYNGKDYSKNLDYVSIWFTKGSQYISNSNSQLAFVSTNSVCQGEHVDLLWPGIFKQNIEIGFAYTSFKWSNNAKGQAVVYCVIINLRPVVQAKKYIFKDSLRLSVKNINAYLVDSENNTILHRRSEPISKLPDVCFGSMANDGGHLIFSNDEYKTAIDANPGLDYYFKKFIGAEEFLNGTCRWVLWINDDDVKDASKYEIVTKRLELVAKNRLSSKRKATSKLASKPYRFGEVRHTGEDAIIIPKLSSERRSYIPMGYVDGSTVISDRAFMVPGAAIWVFGVLSSRMHMVWTEAVSGRLKIDINYSTTIVYNNFPVPSLTDLEEKLVEEKALSVLDARENHPECNLSQMYDPDKMPSDLRLAHHELDSVVDSVYQKKAFINDNERLVCLFDLYENMTEHERKA